MAPNPVVTFTTASQTAFIGTTQTVLLSFDNTGPAGDTGYAPYIDVILPINGADGGGVGNNPVNDGVTLLGATFLGRPLVQTQVVFNAAGQATHPFAKNPDGSAVIVTGNPGDTLLVLTLPFGSFTTEQTPADVTLKLGVSNLADIGTPLPITATGGFAYGADEFNNPGSDAPIRGATASAQIDPVVATLDKIYLGPEQETATGPSYPRQWKVEGNFADGQPFTNVKLTDKLPDGVVYLGGHLEDGAGNTLPGTVTLTGAYGNQTVVGSFNGTIIGGNVTPTLVIDFYVTEFLSTGVPVLDQATGAFRPLENNAKLDADWQPIDTRDANTHITIDPAGPENTVIAKSVAVQKSVALVSPTDDTIINPDADSNGVPDWQPGGTLKYTLDGQVSNYFEMKQLVFKDTLGDGQTFKPGYTPKVVISEHGAVIFSGDVLYTVQPKNAAGQTFIQFDVAGTLAAAKAAGLLPNDDTVLDGNGGGLTGNPHATDYYQATAVVTFETTIDKNYVGPIGAGLDRMVDQGDPVNNDVLFGGQVNKNGNYIEDDSHAGVVLPVSEVGKAIYAINGDTGLGATINDPSQKIQAGDLITYRLTLDMPLTSAHSVKLSDYLPLPVLKALDLDANGVTDGTMTKAANGAIPGVNQWSFGPADTLHTQAGTVYVDPTISRSGPGNSLTFNFGDITNPNYPTTHIDLLFTVRVNDQAFGDGLLLTNQVTSSETNSFGAVSKDNEIVQFVLGEPRLKITKGIVAEDNNTGAYFDSQVGPDGVTWNAPGSASAFTGTITSQGLAAHAVNANLLQADAKDTVTFAIVLENVGSGPRGAFDTVIKDTLPTGFTYGAVPINLHVTDGTGAPVAYTGSAANLFTTGIQLVDPGAHQGAIGAYADGTGKNIVVITYDLRLDNNVASTQAIVNTATTASYAAEEGGINRTPTDGLPDSDDAYVYVTPQVGKTYVSSSNADTGFGEGDGNVPDLAIGELVTWHFTATIAEGTSRQLKLIDILPGGTYAGSGGPFQLVSVTQASVGANITGAGVNAGKTGVISDSNGDGINDTVTFDFGDVTNAADNVANAADTISFDITARVLDTPANYAGETEYNRATVQITAPDGSVRNTDSYAAVEIVEPHLSLDKSATPTTVDANDLITYTVTLTNNNDNYGAPAYDVSIDDLLNQLAPNAVFQKGSVVITSAPAGANAAIVKGNGATDTTVKVTADKLLEGQSITLTFQAKATPGAISGQTVHNDATADATSMPGTPPSDRPYHVTDPADVTIASPSITKSVTATSFADTGSSQFNGGNPDVKVDEIVTYRMVVTVPEGQSINFRIIDQLADQVTAGGGSGILKYIPGSAKVISAGANLSATGGILTPTVTNTDSDSDGNAETVTYSFGNVTNTADNVSDAKDQIVVEIQARAQNLDTNQNGDVLRNSVQAVTDYSQSNVATADVDFVQPELDIQKNTSFGTGDAADIATYTVTIRHTGNSTATAYNLAVGDILAPGITLVPGSAATSAGTITETAGHIALNVASLALGQSITVTYQAKLADTVVDGQTIRNTANLTYQTDPTPGRILNDSDYEDIRVAIRDSIVKDLISTDNSYTPGSNVVAGETITYKLTVTLGEGAQHLIVDDVLPTGLTPVSSRVLSLGNIAGTSTLHVGDAGTVSGQSLTFDFGDVINAGDNTVTAGDKVEIEVVAKVAAGTAGGLALTNTATVRPVTPNNPYGVPPGTPMTPSSDTETVNTLALPKLGDKAFEDLNADGIQQPGEPGIAGVTVQLYSRDTGLLVGTQTTDSNGLYLFTDVKPGTYYEVWSLPPGFVRTTQDQGSDAADSDASAVNGVTADFVMLGGQDDLTRDAGYWKPIKLGDTVTEDVNGNGIQDAGDLPLAGVTVNLLDGSGNVLTSTVTDALGNYLFVGLKPGTYAVGFVKPPGYDFTLKDAGANDALDSDADRTTGQTVAKTYISGADDRTIDAGLYKPVTIGDRVFEDVNGNGVQDGADTNLSGVTVQLLDGNNAVVGSTTTDGNGNYLFTGLRPDSYHIKVIPPAGYAFTAANTPNDALDSDTDQITGISPVKTYLSGDDDRTVDSGLYRPVKIGDLAFYDRNGDGIQNAGDTPLGGVVVQLVNTITNTVVATATTAPDGSYLFTVPPGTYKEIWTTPPGFSPAITGQGTPATDSNPVNGMTAPITLTSGQSDLTQDAGFWQPVTIGDRVFEDQNGNDIQDAGDTNVPNVRVDLLDGAGNIVATQFTDVNGNYLFTGLRPQDYAVKFTPPAGYNITGRDVGGNDLLDSDPNLATGVTVTKTYLGGDDDRSIDAGLWRPVTLGDRVTEDKNGNGIQDAGDVAIPSATVNLFNAAGAVVGTTTTDANGNYLFTGLKPGVYSVEFVKPPGFVFSPALVGGNTAIDSDANTTTGKSVPALHTSGTTDLTIDASLYVPVKLGDRVFLDVNGNGLQDAADQNLAGVTVKLLDGNNAVIGSTTTDANGNYLFTGLAPGSYHVQVIKPDGTYYFTQPDAGADNIDSDTNQATGITPVKLYVSGDDDRTIDSGLYQLAKIGDYAFVDRNGNGINDAGDTPLAGVTVQLVNTATNTVVATATTAPDGSYLFNVPPGTYKEVFTAPPGYVPTITGQGTPATDSNPDATGTTPTFSVPSGGQDLTIDAGFYIPVKIGDRVFEDQNGNGIQDAEDTNLAGVTVNLLDGTGQVVGTQQTDANGNYLFTGLRPADYQVQFVKPAGFITTAPDTGVNDTIDSDASLATGKAPVKTYFSGDDDRTIDAGYYRPVTIGDKVFVDINKDGLQQTLEPGLAGVIVTLIDDRTGTVVGTQTTGVTGDYLFTGYKPSEYHVEFSTPAGYSITTALVGGNRAIDSNPNAAGVAPGIRLLSGQTDLTIDAGYQGSGKVSGNVFLDLPPGICNYKLPDAVFQGVKVELITTTGLIAGTTTTDANGNYLFTNVAPGQYIQRFTNPDGTVFTQPKVAGTLNPRDSDVNPDGLTDAFTVVNGAEVKMINAGLDYTGVGFQGQAPTYLPDGGGSYNFQGGAYAIGGNGSYQMMGNGGAPVYFIGGSGSNNLQGSGSSGAILMGGGGSNIMEGTGGRDIIIGGCGTNNIQGLGSNNFQGLGSGNACWPYDLLVGGVQNDIITSNSGNAIIIGGNGNDAIDGQGVFVGGPNTGTATASGSTVTSYSVGDHLKLSGLSQVNYQVGDGVQLIENYNPGRGDTIEVYGYAAPTATGLVNGQYVLYFGPNAALVISGYQPQNGVPLTGINYHPNQTSMPGAFGHLDALPPVILAAGQDSFYGTQGDDIAIATDAFTTFTGNAGDDIAFGGEGGNLFIDGAGNDSYIGGGGNDIFRLTEGSNQVIGCAGNDVVQFNVTRAQATITTNANGTTVVVTPQGEQVLTGVEWLSFTDQNVQLSPTSGGAVLFGTAGNDQFQITNVNDLIVERPGAGQDTAWISVNGWTLSPEVENGRLINSATSLTGNAMDNVLVANPNAVSTVLGGGGNDEIWGGAANGSVLNGGAGDDVIRSGTGIETMIGGTGNDQFVVNNAGDTIVEKAGEGTDTAWVGVSGWTVSDNIEIVRLFGAATSVNLGMSSAQVVANGGGGTTIVAQAGDNVFYGQGGNDTFVGAGGNDVFYAASGGSGTKMYGGAGNDAFVVKNLGDQAFENAGQGYDTAYVAINGWTVGDNIEVAYLSGAATTLTGGATGGNLVANTTAASTLTAGAGLTTFWGSNFGDTFNAGPGGSTMYGYGGADDFHFGVANWGTSEIADFSHAQGDQLDFRGSGITNINQLVIQNYADKVQILHGADQIILYGVTAPLVNSDFIFA